LATLGDNLSLSAVGPQFAFSVLVGFGIGLGLDALFKTRPWLMLLFIALGIASGIVNLVRLSRQSR
jgi:ATP synthase protein I